MKLFFRNKKAAAAVLITTLTLTACGGGSNVGSPATEPAPSQPPSSSAAVKTSYALFKESGLLPQAVPRTWDTTRAYLDVNGDGTLEIFTAQLQYAPHTSTPETAAPSTFRFYRKQADGSLIEAANLLPQGNAGCIHPRKAVLSDFNNDGRLDIFVACHGYDAAPFPGERNKMVLSQPDGTFRISDASPQVGFFHSVAAADFNGDGKTDVVLTNNFANPSVQVWLNNGSGTFTPSTGYIPNELRRRANFFTVEVPDVNGDGRFDLFVGGHEWENAQTMVFVNAGTGDFSSASPTTLPPIANEGVVLDVVATGDSADRALWVLRTSGGDGTFYQSLTVQKVLWPNLTSTVPLSQRGAPWQPWMIPVESGGVKRITSDDSSVTTINLPY